MQNFPYLGYFCKCFKRRKVGCFNDVYECENYASSGDEVVSPGISNFPRANEITEVQLDIEDASTNVQSSTDRDTSRYYVIQDDSVIREIQNHFRACCSVSDIALENAQHLRMHCKSQLIDQPIVRTDLRRTSVSMPSVLVKNSQLITLFEVDEQIRRSSTNTVTTMPWRSVTNNCANTSHEQESNTTVNNFSTNTEGNYVDIMCKSFLSVDNSVGQSEVFESSIRIQNKGVSFCIADDDDWVAVSDEDTTDESTLTTPRQNFCSGFNKPFIIIPTFSNNSIHNGSYMITSNGSLLFDGLAGIKITNNGIASMNDPSSFKTSIKDRFIFINRLGQGSSATVIKVSL